MSAAAAFAAQIERRGDVGGKAKRAGFVLQHDDERVARHEELAGPAQQLHELCAGRAVRARGRAGVIRELDGQRGAVERIRPAALLAVGRDGERAVGVEGHRGLLRRLDGYVTVGPAYCVHCHGVAVERGRHGAHQVGRGRVFTLIGLGCRWGGDRVAGGKHKQGKHRDRDADPHEFSTHSDFRLPDLLTTALNTQLLIRRAGEASRSCTLLPVVGCDACVSGKCAVLSCTVHNGKMMLHRIDQVLKAAEPMAHVLRRHRQRIPPDRFLPRSIVLAPRANNAGSVVQVILQLCFLRLL